LFGGKFQIQTGEIVPELRYLPRSHDRDYRHILTQGNELNVPHLEVKDSAARKVARVASSFREAERRVIIDALSDASGRIAGKGGAAERLGLKRTTLLNKMRRLSISRIDYFDQYTNRIAGPQATS